MQISVKELTEACAKEICKWRYEKPYDIYNMPDWNIVNEQNWGIANESKRQNEFRAVFKDDELIGFFRLVKNSANVTIGLGLRPDYCGKSFGSKLITFALKESKIKYVDIPIHLEVRDFNIRAIRCYERMGFKEIDRYTKATPIGNGNFIVMELHTK